VATTRVMWMMRSGSTPQGLSKSESHLASLKGDGSPTREVRTFSKGQRAVGPIHRPMICARPIARARAL
jgi:hypothetical protein